MPLGNLRDWFRPDLIVKLLAAKNDVLLGRGYGSIVPARSVSDGHNGDGQSSSSRAFRRLQDPALLSAERLSRLGENSG